MTRSCMASRVALILWPTTFVVRSPLQIVVVSTTSSIWWCEVLWTRARSDPRSGRGARESAVLLGVVEMSPSIRTMVATKILLLVALLVTTILLLVLKWMILRSIRCRVGVLTIRWRGTMHSKQISGSR